MKIINEKWSLFLVATFTVFFGITNSLLKGTEAKDNDYLTDVVMLDFNENGLHDIIVGNMILEIKSGVYTYDIEVNELNNLSIIPVLTNNSIMHTIDIIGDINIDKSVIAIISIGLENTKKIRNLLVRK